ncbi:terminase large subunit domain-containing protein [Salinisphaera orenii]|uniref:Uncharacterized protein n=1 Tax=Salinisphaera orenii YIM 95161 TaxID=1051139 RepID=A0A423PDS1_9GAMM|nr:terminase family protein [Salinisphaera halophila]ROO23779.1 hypothetical protein SAHL_16465 [Salinisphaera halophila YIM 95161]
MAEVAERIEPSAFQARVLATPEQYDVALTGGRGGGKTFALLLLILRHVEMHGINARVLVVRKNFPDLRDFEAEARYLFGTAYGSALSYNAQQHIFRFPNQATVQLDQLESQADFIKFQGKSFSLIAVEEAGQYPDPRPLDLLRSSLRSKANVPCRLILSANPGGSGHAWMNQRHVAGQSPWLPYIEPKSGRTFVTAPSTLHDNPHLGADYGAQIKAATASDAELQKAWLHGDWNIARGAFFGQVFDTARNVIAPWAKLPDDPDWEFFVAGDHGSAAPAVFYLCARSMGAQDNDGRFYPADSIVLFDEIAFVEKDTLNQGLGMTVPDMASLVIAACHQWVMTPAGCMDDACFSNHGSDAGTLAQEYRRAGLRIDKADKGERLAGWQKMRRMMADAGLPDKPGLYISERCGYWLRTVPYLDRSQNRPEDLDTTAADHGADACRYALTYQRPMFTRRKTGVM